MSGEPMTARERVEAMIRTSRGSMTVWPEAVAREALDAYRAEVLAAEEIGPASSGDWRQDMETTRLARNTIHYLRKALDAGRPVPMLAAEQLTALADEFDRMRAIISTAWKTAADKLAATPHNPTALTGPYWYGQGWDDAVHHLRDLADGMDPGPRHIPKEQP